MPLQFTQSPIPRSPNKELTYTISGLPPFTGEVTLSHLNNLSSCLASALKRLLGPNDLSDLVEKVSVNAEGTETTITITFSLDIPVDLKIARNMSLHGELTVVTRSLFLLIFSGDAEQLRKLFDNQEREMVE